MLWQRIFRLFWPPKEFADFADIECLMYIIDSSKSFLLYRKGSLELLLFILRVVCEFLDPGGRAEGSRNSQLLDT